MLKNEPLLKQALERLPARSRVAFAVSCAQRLQVAYHRFLAQQGLTHRAIDCDGALEYVWSHVLAAPQTDVVQRMLAVVMALIPDEDAPGWTPLTVYGEDALASLAYCLSCLLSSDSQEAAWVARRAYESLDYFVSHRDDVDPNDAAAEARVLADPMIQAEFARQQRDIADLTHLGESLSQEFVNDLRRRSEREQIVCE